MVANTARRFGRAATMAVTLFPIHCPAGTAATMDESVQDFVEVETALKIRSGCPNLGQSVEGIVQDVAVTFQGRGPRNRFSATPSVQELGAQQSHKAQAEEWRPNVNVHSQLTMVTAAEPNARPASRQSNECAGVTLVPNVRIHSDGQCVTAQVRSAKSASGLPTPLKSNAAVVATSAADNETTALPLSTPVTPATSAPANSVAIVTAPTRAGSVTALASAEANSGVPAMAPSASTTKENVSQSTNSVSAPSFASEGNTAGVASCDVGRNVVAVASSAPNSNVAAAASSAPNSNVAAVPSSAPRSNVAAVASSAPSSNVAAVASSAPGRKVGKPLSGSSVAVSTSSAGAKIVSSTASAPRAGGVSTVRSAFGSRTLVKDAASAASKVAASVVLPDPGNRAAITADNVAVLASAASGRNGAAVTSDGISSAVSKGSESKGVRSQDLRTRIAGSKIPTSRAAGSSRTASVHPRSKLTAKPPCKSVRFSEDVSPSVYSKKGVASPGNKFRPPASSHGGTQVTAHVRTQWAVVRASSPRCCGPPTRRSRPSTRPAVPSTGRSGSLLLGFQRRGRSRVTIRHHCLRRKEALKETHTSRCVPMSCSEQSSESTSVSDVSINSDVSVGGSDCLSVQVNAGGRGL